MTKLLASLRSVFVMDELPAWAPSPSSDTQQRPEPVRRGLPRPRQDRHNAAAITTSESQS